MFVMWMGHTVIPQKNVVLVVRVVFARQRCCASGAVGGQDTRQRVSCVSGVVGGHTTHILLC